MNKHQSYLFAENKLSTVSQSCLALSIQYFICSFISTLLRFLGLLLSYTNPEIDFYQVHSYKKKWAYLERQDNPFAIVVMAHLKALETRKDHSLRKQWKTELTRLLYERGYSRTGIINLYRFIDWVLTLPEVLEEIRDNFPPLVPALFFSD